MIADPDLPHRIYATRLCDPTRWQAFAPRVGDIVVSTPPKSGTTWTQAILAMLIAGDPGVDAETSMKSPWIDLPLRDLDEVMARLAAQDHRRQVKSHTPLDGIPIWPDLRYVTVYRHPIDVHFSMRRHVSNMAPALAAGMMPDDLAEGFAAFLEEDDIDAVSLSSIIDHYRATLAQEPRENLLRLHYVDMLRDLPGTVARISAHVGLPHPSDVMDQIVQAATFASMKANANRFTPSAGQGFWQSDAGFFDSASSNKWEGRLSDVQLAAYDRRIASLLSPDERAWLEWGSGAG